MHCCCYLCEITRLDLKMVWKLMCVVKQHLLGHLVLLVMIEALIFVVYRVQFKNRLEF